MSARFGRCDNCGRACRPHLTSTSHVPGVTICDRAGCRDVASCAKMAYMDEVDEVVGFGYGDRPIRVEASP